MILHSVIIPWCLSFVRYVFLLFSLYCFLFFCLCFVVSVSPAVFSSCFLSFLLSFPPLKERGPFIRLNSSMLALVNNESEKEECGERETVLGNAACPQLCRCFAAVMLPNDSALLSVVLTSWGGWAGSREAGVLPHAET